MILFGLRIGLLTLLGAGAGVTLLLGRGPQPRNILELLAWAWLLGAGAISLLLWTGGFFLTGIALRAAVTGAAVALILAGWKKSRAEKIRFFCPRPHAFASPNEALERASLAQAERSPARS